MRQVTQINESCHAPTNRMPLSNCLQSVTHKQNLVQHTATHCNTLQHPAIPCNTLQHIDTNRHACPPLLFSPLSKNQRGGWKKKFVAARPRCSPRFACPWYCRPGVTGWRWTGLASTLMYLPSCMYPHFFAYERPQHLCAYTHIYILNFCDPQHSGAGQNLNRC